jgi:hypothetical protein
LFTLTIPIADPWSERIGELDMLGAIGQRYWKASGAALGVRERFDGAPEPAPL